MDSLLTRISKAVASAQDQSSDRRSFIKRAIAGASVAVSSVFLGRREASASSLYLTKRAGCYAGNGTKYPIVTYLGCGGPYVFDFYVTGESLLGCKLEKSNLWYQYNYGSGFCYVPAVYVTSRQRQACSC